ncbi:MAG: hypothetical protein IJT83_13980 [Victivallales bacterium]|nr:hypothetical protein [Victivallales bacterium]
MSEQTPAVPAADELRELWKGQEELRKGQEELLKGQEDITEALCAICESGLVELEKDIAKLREETAKVSEKEEIIDKLHTELLATRKQVSGELVKPYLRVMMEFSGKLEGITAHYAEKLDALEELPPAVLDFKKEMMSISETLVDTLDDTFGYVVFAPEIGEKFNPREANCVGRVAAEQNGQEGQAGTIARVSRRGFRDAESGQIIMFPDVVVFK